MPRARATRLTEDRDTGADHRLAELSARSFRQLFAAVSNWERWGEEDERGAINELTPDRVAAAAQLVHSRETVTLSHPLNERPGIDNPEPADHHMTMLADVDVGSGALRFAKDYIGLDYHNPPHSHIDALCHVASDRGSIQFGPSRTSSGIRMVRTIAATTAPADASGARRLQELPRQTHQPRRRDPICAASRILIIRANPGRRGASAPAPPR